MRHVQRARGTAYLGEEAGTASRSKRSCHGGICRGVLDGLVLLLLLLALLLLLSASPLLLLSIRQTIPLLVHPRLIFALAIKL